MKHSTSALSVLFLMASSSVLMAKDPSQVISSCLSALQKNDTVGAQKFVSQLRDMRPTLSKEEEKEALACLEGVHGDQWRYSRASRRFSSETERAAIKEIRDRKLLEACLVTLAEVEVEQASLAVGIAKQRLNTSDKMRSLEVVRQTKNACIDLYNTDPASALLSPICNPILLEVGIPDSNDPKLYSDLADAEKAYRAAIAKLDGLTNDERTITTIDTVSAADRAKLVKIDNCRAIVERAAQQ